MKTDKSVSDNNVGPSLAILKSKAANFVVQQEPLAESETNFSFLTYQDLNTLSKIMVYLLRLAGAKQRDRLMVYDFNTSISTLALSRVFAPSMKVGACDRIGCVPILTDGLSELASRSAYIYELCQPEILIVRSDLLAPFCARLPKGLESHNPRLRTVLIIQDDALPWPVSRRLGQGSFDRFLLYRVDGLLFMCLIKPCGGIYYHQEFHSLEPAFEKPPTEVDQQRMFAITSVLPYRLTETRLTSLEYREDGGKCECGESHEFRTGRRRI